MKNKRCYLCNQDDLKVIPRKLRHGIKRIVLECQHCSLTYLKPVEENSKKFYEAEYRKLYSPILGKELNSRELFEIYLPYQKSKIEQIQHILNPGMKVLDLGCAAGYFLYTIKDYVQECIGIEFNKKNADFVTKELGFKTYTNPIEETDLPLESFDLITAYHLLEHIDDPIHFLKTISNYLKDEGFIVIEVPNIQNALLSLFNIQPYSDFWFCEPHLFYYSPKTLSQILDHSGFTGNTTTVQNYNFLNNLHWMFTGKPQERIDLGVSAPILINSNSTRKDLKEEFNRWMKKVDEEYKELLAKHELSDSILFIGQKKK
jgi:2-polyprenyl-3-methyl-5-hydroxy-6-metoxy-1,4-benzoquinol methylase